LILKRLREEPFVFVFNFELDRLLVFNKKDKNSSLKKNFFSLYSQPQQRKQGPIGAIIRLKRMLFERRRSEFYAFSDFAA
jgi:hypothetical protein